MLIFSASISCTDLVSLPLALSIIVEDTGQVLSLQREWEADSEISKMFCWRPVPSPPGPPALTPVSLAQTFTPACPAALWHHWEVISACPQEKSPKPASTIFPNSVNGDPVLPLPHPRHHSPLLLQLTPVPSAGLPDSPFQVCLECDPLSPFLLLPLWSWPLSSLT